MSAPIAAPFLPPAIPPIIAPPTPPPAVVSLSLCFCQKLRPCLCPSPTQLRCVCVTFPCLCRKLPHCCACAVIGTMATSMVNTTRPAKNLFIFAHSLSSYSIHGRDDCEFEVSIELNEEERKPVKPPQALRCADATGNSRVHNPQIYNRRWNPVVA